MGDELRERGRARGRVVRRPLIQVQMEKQNQSEQMDQNEKRDRSPRSRVGTLPNQPVQLSQMLAGIHLGSGDASVQTQVKEDKSNVVLHTRPTALTSKIGTSGKKVIFQANYFNLMKTPDWALLQYRVDFDPDEERTFARKGMLKVFKDEIGAYMFDGTSLFTLTKLKSDPLELFILKKETDQKIRIIIKFTNQVLIGDPQYIQFFNIVLRQCIDALDLQLVGRHYYDAEAKVSVREFNFEIWPGLITSIKQHEKNLLLNIDISHKIMRKETAFDLLRECRENFRNDYEMEYAKAIVGSTVITYYNNKTYKIDNVDFSLTPKSTFVKQNENISYLKYYKERYGINIKNDYQPLLVSSPTARDIRGGRPGSILLVPELCNLTGLTDAMRNKFDLMRALADHTRVQPVQRMKNYYTFLNRISRSPRAQEVLNTWNLKFDKELTNAPGRIFDNEKIKMGNNKFYVTDHNADWKRSFREMPMKYVVPLNKWAVIYPIRNRNEIERFVRTLIQAGKGINFQISQPMEWYEVQNDRPQFYVEAIENLINNCAPAMIMSIVPNNKADRYAAIKRKCYVDRAIPNQVVLAKNLRGKDLMSIASKIAIQINCKMGGIPWSIYIPFKVPAMIAGFDVCHDTSKKFSFGSLVASLDKDYSKYYSAVKKHDSGVELSDTISAYLSAALGRFVFINKRLPSRIILYRDGVGDGNLENVYQHEVKSIKNMLALVYETDNPPLIVCVVSKRINTRIFYQNNNPPPGSVVDDVITVPEKFDFFLVSQSVRQGTVTPTSYSVIHDASGLTPDHIQRLTYKMTHMYYNFTGTIRVPAPCQYAHKLAFMAGQFLHTEPNQGMNDVLYFL